MAQAITTTEVIVGIVTAVPATIAALAAWRNARSAKNQTTPSNGAKLSTIIEDTRDDVRDLKADFRDHKRSPANRAHGR
jgi:hypothetical protein